MRPVAVQQLGDALAVARKAGGLEQCAVVAEALGADVGAVADDAAVGVGGLLDLPVDPLVGRVLGAVLAEVGERVAHLHDLAEPALFDGLHVGKPGAGGLLGLPVGEGVSTGVDVRRLDGDVGVVGLVLGVEVVETLGAERGDGQRDGLIAVAFFAAAGGTGGCEEGDGCSTRDGCGNPGAS